MRVLAPRPRLAALQLVELATRGKDGQDSVDVASSVVCFAPSPVDIKGGQPEAKRPKLATGAHASVRLKHIFVAVSDGTPKSRGRPKLEAERILLRAVRSMLGGRRRSGCLVGGTRSEDAWHGRGRRVLAPGVRRLQRGREHEREARGSRLGREGHDGLVRPPIREGSSGARGGGGVRYRRFQVRRTCPTQRRPECVPACSLIFTRALGMIVVRRCERLGFWDSAYRSTCIGSLYSIHCLLQ